MRHTVSSAGLVAAIRSACAKVHYSIDRPGMYARTLFDRLDHKLQGDVATLAVAEYLQVEGVSVATYDSLRTDSYRNPDPGYDLIVPTATGARSSGVHISVKSSLLAPGDTLETAIATRDFKVFADGSPLHACLQEVEIQAYYDRHDRGMPVSLSADAVRRASEDAAAASAIERAMRVRERWGTVHLVSWCDRETLVEWSRAHGWKKWQSRKGGYAKSMWVLPLRVGAPIDELPGWLDERSPRRSLDRPP